MSKFTDRLEHDLSQIADRATPSSTAWESIQHRIDEQTTQPTMEVIMLNPDQKKPPTISRTWMAVAAALVAVVGVGSLFAVFNQDDENDIDTVDTPEVTVPLELDAEQEPDVLVPDESAPDDGSESNAAVADPEESLAMTGFATADCNFGPETLDPDGLSYSALQSCKFRENNVVPFAPIQQYVVTRYEDPAIDDASTPPFGPITGLSDSGFMYAGYLWDGQPNANVRFVGVADGLGPYEGMLIRVTGRSFGDDLGRVYMQWVAGDDLSPLTISGTDVEAVEVTSDCAITGFVEDADGDPETEQFTTTCATEAGLPEERNTYLFGTAFNTVGTGGYRYAVTTGSSVNSGLLPRNGGAALSVGIAEGTGDNEGLLLHQLTIGTATASGDLETTTVQVALPPAE